MQEKTNKNDKINKTKKDNDQELREILKKIEILDDLLESVKREDREKKKREE